MSSMTIAAFDDISNLVQLTQVKAVEIYDFLVNLPNLLRQLSFQQAKRLKKQEFLRSLGQKLGLYKPKQPSRAGAARSRRRRRAMATPFRTPRATDRSAVASATPTSTPVPASVSDFAPSVVSTPMPPPPPPGPAVLDQLPQTPATSLPPPPPPLQSALDQLHADIASIMRDSPSNNMPPPPPSMSVSGDGGQADVTVTFANGQTGGGSVGPGGMAPLPPPPPPPSGVTAGISVTAAGRPSIAGAFPPPPPPPPHAAASAAGVRGTRSSNVYRSLAQQPAQASSPVINGRSGVPFSGTDMESMRTRLRRVPRSPNGTPMRPRPSGGDGDDQGVATRDTQSIIALALRKKFASFHSSAFQSPPASPAAAAGSPDRTADDRRESLAAWSPAAVDLDHPAYHVEPKTTNQEEDSGARAPVNKRPARSPGRRSSTRVSSRLSLAAVAGAVSPRRKSSRLSTVNNGGRLSMLAEPAQPNRSPLTDALFSPPRASQPGGVVLSASPYSASKQQLFPQTQDENAMF